VQSVNYLELIPLLTKAIQEQQEIIDSQSEQLKKQDAKYQQLEKRMKQFELLAARDE